MFASKQFSPRVSLHVFHVFFRVLPGAITSALYLLIVFLADPAFAQGWNQRPVDASSVDQTDIDQGNPDQPASDRATAVRVLGPQWEQMSCRAGIIFVGTVVSSNPASAAVDQVSLISATMPATLPTIQVRFRVDRAIAGTETGQILTIHEWAGTSSTQRPMNTGQHVLLFLYAPSRLGFTSPVGGAAGEVFLDPTGKSVTPKPAANFRSLNTSELYPPTISLHPAVRSVSVLQLERAVRSARQMRER
jgi:hypothetical protein